MHSLLYVVVEKACLDPEYEDGEMSLAARELVTSVLDSNNFANSEGGSPADWYVIGGRWSGRLTRFNLDQTRYEEFIKRYSEEGLGGVSLAKPEEVQRQRAHEVFKEIFPEFEGEIPVWRDSYQSLGYDDDACQLTQEIWDKIKAGASAEVEYSNWDTPAKVIEISGDTDYQEINDEAVDIDDRINEYMVVVVDFHN